VPYYRRRRAADGTVSSPTSCRWRPRPDPRDAPHLKDGLGRLTSPASPGVWAAYTCWWRWTPTAANPRAALPVARRDRNGADLGSLGYVEGGRSVTGAGVWRSPRPPTPTRACCSASISTTSPPATAPTGAKCWRKSTCQRSLQGAYCPDRPYLAQHQQRFLRVRADHVSASASSGDRR